ncbi:hypothetical protein [Streptomyces sp. NPDC002692]
MTHPAEDQEQADVRAEDVPDGTFGHARHRLPEHMTPCTPDEQAQHLAALGAAVSGFRVGAALSRRRSR